MAHKKGVGSSRNGRDSNPKYRGVKKYGGEQVIPGNIIIRQCGTKWHPGANVGEEGALADKTWRQLQAECALVGAGLEQSTTDRDQIVFIVTVGPCVLKFHDLPAVRSWLRLRQWCVRQRPGAAA